MNNLFKCIIMLLFLSSCSSFEKIEVETKETNYKIILTPEIERPKLNYYSIDFNYLNEDSLRCFDKKNGDLFNENYYNLIKYIKELENDNNYLRNEIKINNMN